MKKFGKNLYRTRYLPLLMVPLLVVMMVLPGTLMAAPYTQTVDLGTAGNFAVLAGTAVNDANISSIIGNVGLSPAAWGSSTPLITQTEVNGTIYSVDASGPGGRITDPGLLTNAKNALTAAYIDAAGRTPVTPIAAEQLGGKTLTPGVYSFGGAASNLTGTLTLNAEGDPNAVFIFLASSTLITASDSIVSLIGSASPCNVFWQVTSSATLGTRTQFVGTIMALDSITDNGYSTINGRLLARNAAVTLNYTTLTILPCGAPTARQGILTIFKVDGDRNPIVATTSAMSAAFNIYANAGDVGVKPPLEAGSTIQDTNFFRVSLPNGTYYVVEKTAPKGYSADSTVRSVTIANGEATLTFVNGSGGESSSGTATTAGGTATTTPVTSTVAGGQLPKTGTPWYNILLIGIVLILTGAMSWVVVKKKRTE